jgi:hypothetical protein
MKKLLVCVIAALFCVALAAPAMAETKIGGMVQADILYKSFDEERGVANGLAAGTANNIDSYSTVEFASPQAFNRVWWDWKSDDKKLAAMIQLRSGGQKATATENNFTWEYAWIDWHLTPNFYLRIGRQTQAFAIYHHGMTLGHNFGLNALVGFGNVTGTTSRDGIRAYIKFNDNVRMEIQAINPDTDATAETSATGLTLRNNVNGVIGAAREENTIPRFDISIPIKIANFQIEPALTYLKQEFEQTFAGSEDSIDIWGASLGMKAGFGPLTITGEVTYGENFGSSSSYVYLATPTLTGSAGGGAYPNVGAASIYQPTGSAANTRAVEDTENLGAFIDLGFDFGPFEIHGYVGYARDQNDGDPALARNVDASEWDVERWAYGVNFPIKVAKNFTVTPEVTFYDFGGGEEYGPTSTTNDVDFGKAMVLGVSFRLTF